MKHDATSELGLEMPAEKAPGVTAADVAWLIGVLAAHDWITAKELGAATGVNDRKIRAIASEARPRVVSYPGSPGYKLWEKCTVPEHRRCMAAIKSQLEDMRESYVAYWTAFHTQHPGA